MPVAPALPVPALHARRQHGHRAAAALLACALACSLPAAAADAAGAVGACDASAGCEGDAPAAARRHWADESYDYVTSRTDALAVWLDSFFGTVSSDMESADSVLRLRLEHEWDQENGEDTKVRLRGKVHLPRLDERLSLVFSEEDVEREEVIPQSGGTDDDVGLQYRLRQRESSRLWFTVGTNSSLDFKSSLRYRYVQPIGEDWRVQFSPRLYFKEGEGFGTITRADLDYRISDNRIVRWTNQGEFGEETNGVEWGTRLSYQMRLSNRHALSYFGAVAGETDEDYFAQSYALGVRYRRNLFRPWIFVELEPSHAWRRESAEESRSSVWLLTMRLEFLEERRNRRARRPGDDAGSGGVD